ncbi:MAG: HEPN domain-containing protein [Candidatus Omnitrophica bacterium]|nr:HEPN domain-containing protein [Candidatus Omnitrophota bacterium]
MNKAIENWIKSSEYDFKTSKAMYKGGRYIYVIFMCHLTIEKFLKAVVAKKTKKIPPKTHDLFYLIKLANLEIRPAHQKIISHLNQASIPTRYPEDIAKISKQYNKSVAERYLKETGNLLRWLKGIIK